MRVLALAGLLLTFCVGCGRATTATSAGGGLRVVAAENFWGSIAAQLGGTKARVTSVITSPATDPHDYEPTAADARTIAGARMVIVNGVGTASVYRALEQLTKDGFVQRIDIGAGASRFEPIHADGEHHHHLVCDDCGKVEAFADDELERALRKVERRTGYSVAGHDVVLRGACDDCAPVA